MQDFLNQKVLIGVTGGVAAYKVAQLVRELKKSGAQVKVVMSQAATRFITPLTFQALSGEKVLTSLWEENTAHSMDHIQLARWPDVFLIAPATANTIAKLAQGMADDLITTIALVTQTPLILCPAMNPSMYQHAATQANLQLLADRGALIIEPEAGEAACGEEGVGRLVEIEHLLQVLRLYPLHGMLSGQTWLITAGPTRERIDPVRYLSNDSSGKMGYALAYAAWVAGAKVILITGPTALTPPPGVIAISVETAHEMLQAVRDNLVKGCIFVGAAAVADYGIEKPHTQKMKKKDSPELHLALVKNPDILNVVTQAKLARLVIGFSAETEDVIQNALKKLTHKQIDLIIANEVGSGIGFNQDDQAVTLLTSSMQLGFPKMNKVRLGGELVKWLANYLSHLTASKQTL